MEALENRIAYLRGLADGLDVGTQSAEGKMLAEMIEILDDMQAEIHVLHTRLEETEDYVEAIDEDLGEMELFLFDDNELLYETVDDDEDEYSDLDDDEAAYMYESIDEDEFDTSYEFTCPSCQKGIKFHEGMDEEGYLHYVIEPFQEKAGFEPINPT
ncbi:CD1247 N-terminal domain-containing protein [Brevibacillus invocatus]